MAAIPGKLDAPIDGASRRVRTRRTLHLRAQETASLGGAEVIVLDLSPTGLLLQTSGVLAADETIELELPGAAPVSAIVKWSTGQFYGCQFVTPVSDAFVSAALLRSAPQPAAPMPTLDGGIDAAGLDLPDAAGKISRRARLGVIAGLAALSWGVIAALAVALL